MKEENILFMEMETKVLDRNAEWFGVTTEQLMENAGRAVAEVTKKLPYRKWLVVCGSGNNGGDGYVAARYIKNCTIVAVSRPKTGLAMKNYRRAKAVGIPIYAYEKKKFEKLLEESEAVIDAMLGVGIKGELKEPYKEIVKMINSSGKYVLSVDVPTGLGGDTFIRASATVTFDFIKEGMEGKSGEIIVADIGIPREAKEEVGAGDMLYYPKPKKESHKGENGVVAVIGGGPYTGAPALAGMAALRGGCDLAFICCPSEIAGIVAGFSPNLIIHRLDGKVFSPENIGAVEEIVEKADAVLIGPGLGNSNETVRACREFLEKYADKKTIVIDADAIKAAKGIYYGGKAIITPHAGEFRELTGIKLPPDIEERKKIVRKEAKKIDATILLKGYVDIISDGIRIKINHIHNEAMTAGGTGDVLAGICAALLAKKVPPFNAACMAAFINGMAGNMVYEEKGYGLIASDLLDKIPEVIMEFI